LQFENSQKGIRKCIAWLATLTSEKTQLIIGIEGGQTRHTLASYLLDDYPHVYEVNPLFTKQRRMLGTRTGKSDPADAKLIAEVLTRKLSLLPKFHQREFSPQRFCLRKTVKFYEEITVQGARLKNRLRQLDREYELARETEERAVLRAIRREKRAELERIKRLQKKLTNKLSLLIEKQGENLTTIKGVSTILAHALLPMPMALSGFQRLQNSSGMQALRRLKNHQARKSGICGTCGITGS
jgi:transposase